MLTLFAVNEAYSSFSFCLDFSVTTQMSHRRALGRILAVHSCKDSVLFQVFFCLQIMAPIVASWNPRTLEMTL